MPASPDDGAAYAAQVATLADELELHLLRRLAFHLQHTDDVAGRSWERDALQALQAWRVEADTAVRGAEQRLLAAVTEALMKARKDGADLAAGDLEDLNLEAGKPASAGQVRRRAEQLARHLFAALQAVPRLLEPIYRQAVAIGAGEVLGGKVTRLQAAQHVLDRLIGHGITGFRDRAGRNWALHSYIEMAVRTEAGHQAIQGHVDALTDAGIELVVVSDSPRECPLCRKWEGKVLSLNGQTGTMIVPSVLGGRGVRVEVDGTLGEARRGGLFHPNCRHSVSAFLPGATELRKPKADPVAYEAGQRQREMERKVRDWKRREALALDDAARAQATVKVRDWQKKLREHVAQNGLKRRRTREQIGLAT